MIAVCLLCHLPCHVLYADVTKLSWVVSRDERGSSCLSRILMMCPVARLLSCISSLRKNKQCGVRIKVSFEMLSSNRAEGTDSLLPAPAERRSLCFLCLLRQPGWRGEERKWEERREGNMRSKESKCRGNKTKRKIEERKWGEKREGTRRT